MLLHKDKSDPIAYVVIFQGLVAIIIASYAILHGFHVPDFKAYWFPILVTILLYSAGHIAYAKTLQQVEASVFSVFFATNAIWVMLAGIIVFHEHLNIGQLLGALFIFASVSLLAEHAGLLKMERSIILGLLTGLLFGLATIGWTYVGRHADAASWSAFSFGGPSLVVLLSNPSSLRKMRPFMSGSTFLRILVLGVLFSVSAVTLLLAYQKANVSLVAPSQQSSIIITMLLAVIFLHERTHLWRKICASLLCFIGVLLIV